MCTLRGPVYVSVDMNSTGLYENLFVVYVVRHVRGERYEVFTLLPFKHHEFHEFIIILLKIISMPFRGRMKQHRLIVNNSHLARSQVLFGTEYL